MHIPASCSCGLVLLVALFLIPLPTQAQTSIGVQPQLGLSSPTEPPSRTRFLRWAYQDAVGLAQSADGRTPLYVAGAAAALVPLSMLDTRIGEGMQGRQQDGPLSGFLNVANEFGGPKMNIPVVAIFAASLATDNTRFQDAAFTSLQSVVYAGAISYGLKYSFGRFRPEEWGDPYHFSPFSGRSSFPSGHTTTVFAVITPWVLYYPHPVTYGLFAVCGGTALSRMAREKHWATDVLAGGTLGFLTAYWLTKQHQQEMSRVTVMPSFGAKSASLQITVKL